MKVKVINLIDLSGNAPLSIHPALRKVLDANYKAGIVRLGRLTYQLNKIAEGVASAWKAFEASRCAIVDALDAEDEEANKGKAQDDVTRVNWRMISEEVERFNEEFASLLETEVELYGDPLPLAVIDQARELELNRLDMQVLAWLFEQEKKEDENHSNV